MNTRKKAIFYKILSSLFFAFMSFFVQLSGDVPVFQKAFFRNLIAASIAFPVFLREHGSLNIGRSNWNSLFLRSLCGTSGMICNLYAFSHINLSDANLLNKLSPFFAILSSMFILHEIATRRNVIIIITAFLGALLVIKPAANAQLHYTIAGALGGALSGVAYTYVRKLGTRGERGPVIVFFFSVFSTLCVLPFMIADFQPMPRVQLLQLLAAGACAAGGQLSITAAYTKAPAKEISVFDYSQILFAALLGFVFLDELPDLYSLIGYIIIIGAAVWRMRVNLKAGK